MLILEILWVNKAYSIRSFKNIYMKKYKNYENWKPRYICLPIYGIILFLWFAISCSHC